MISGCSSEPETQESSAEPAPSSTAYVPASANGPAQNVPKPEFTKELQELTVDDAEGALQHWWDALHYLRLTEDADQIRALSDDNCQLCEILIVGWEKNYENGSWSAVEPNTISEAVSYVDEEENEVLIDFVLSEPKGDFYDSDGNLVKEKSQANNETSH